MQRNYKHSVTGARLKLKYEKDDDEDEEEEGESTTAKQSTLELWYRRASKLIASDMVYLTEEAATNGQIDATTLNDKMAEMLQLYLDHQETWQEVCLVLEKTEKEAISLVLNRPMAMKLTESLGQLVLYGGFSDISSGGRSTKKTRTDLNRFMRAFGSECALYIGGMSHMSYTMGMPCELEKSILSLSHNLLASVFTINGTYM